jgi:hypothetical protein
MYANTYHPMTTGDGMMLWLANLSLLVINRNMDMDMDMHDDRKLLRP